MLDPLADAFAAPDALALIEADGSIGTWSWDFQSETLLGSPGIYKILGCDPNKPLDVQACIRLIHPDDRARAKDIGTALACRGNRLQHYRIIRSNGEMRWLGTRGMVAHSPDGTPSRMVGVTFDVTEVKAALDARQREAGLLTAIRDLFDVVVWKVEADGSVADLMEWCAAVGPAGRRHAGWKRLDDVHPDDRQSMREAWAEAVACRHRYTAEFRARSGEGQYVSVVSRGAPVFDPRGEIVSWIGISVIKDLDDLNQADALAGMAPSQIRAARGFLGWTVAELAEAADVSISTVRRLEAPGKRMVGREAAVRVRHCLEASGVTFTLERDGGRGIITRPPRRP